MKRFKKLTAFLAAMVMSVSAMSLSAGASGTFNFHIDRTGSVTNTEINAGHASQKDVAYTTSVINSLNAKGIAYEITVGGESPTNNSGTFTQAGTYNKSHRHTDIEPFDSIMVELTLRPYDSAFGSNATGTVYGG